MNIVSSKLYEEQLKEILVTISYEDDQVAKKFKMYLDTVIMNISSKEMKYKKSIYFDNENIKDIEFQGCVIPFLVDRENTSYVILGITRKR